MRWAARSVAGALDASGSDARVLMGVPTYETFGFMHRRGVETPENALVGVVAGLRGLGAGGTFEGVALYAEWTTDEWRLRAWRNRLTSAHVAQRARLVEGQRLPALPLLGQRVEGVRRLDADAAADAALDLGAVRREALLLAACSSSFQK